MLFLLVLKCRFGLPKGLVFDWFSSICWVLSLASGFAYPYRHYISLFTLRNLEHDCLGCSLYGLGGGIFDDEAILETIIFSSFYLLRRRVRYPHLNIQLFVKDPTLFTYEALEIPIFFLLYGFCCIISEIVICMETDGFSFCSKYFSIWCESIHDFMLDSIY